MTARLGCKQVRASTGLEERLADLVTVDVDGPSVPDPVLERFTVLAHLAVYGELRREIGPEQLLKVIVAVDDRVPQDERRVRGKPVFLRRRSFSEERRDAGTEPEPDETDALYLRMPCVKGFDGGRQIRNVRFQARVRSHSVAVARPHEVEAHDDVAT